MKKYQITLLFLLISYLGKCQFVTLPDNNFATCLSDYGLCNAQNKLDTTKAKLFTGVLDCSGRDIMNLTGIKYFINCSEIQMNSDSLLVIAPELNNLTKLTKFFARNSYVSELPNMDKMTSLISIDCANNIITKLGKFPPNLEELKIYANTFNSLIDISNLTKLKSLNCIYNPTTTLSDLNKNPLLETLIFGGNKNFKNFPNITSLPKLTTIYANNSGFKYLGNLESQLLLKEIDFSDCELDSLSSFTENTVLKSVKIFNNHLSFKQLLKIALLPTFDIATSVLLPQKMVGKPVVLELQEGENLVFQRTIDSDLTGLQVSWLKGKNVFSTGTDILLEIPKLQATNADTFYCELRSSNPFLNSGTVTSAPIILKVNKKLSVVNDEIQWQAIGCNGLGTIQLNPNLSIKGGFSPYTYQLKGTSGKVYLENKNGVFNEISDSYCILSVTDRTGFSIQHPITLQDNRSGCDEVVLSPFVSSENAKIYFKNPGLVRIIHSEFGLVKEFNAPNSWDCTDQNGKIVAPGFYIAMQEGNKNIKISVLH